MVYGNENERNKKKEIVHWVSIRCLVEGKLDFLLMM